jgi:glycosyltransferase involved in cell wall biosynthesis
MKLSFVIPAYNEEARIAKCLEALLGEIKKGNFDAEVLVVNNASTDNTATVAKTFPEVTVIDEPRKGLSQARQTGFEHSSGDLIANIDADTVMQPGWIDTVLKTFTDKPDILALSGPHYFYDIPKTQRFITQVFYRLAYASYLLNKHEVAFPRTHIVWVVERDRHGCLSAH